jgi:hypothetical protein
LEREARLDVLKPARHGVCQKPKPQAVEIGTE